MYVCTDYSYLQLLCPVIWFSLEYMYMSWYLPIVSH
jgi:hypothetical protein